ncbi:MAG: hypothetical protein JWP32_2901 [Schumannella sp.]|nr:hypothetical protein [Schumannella sp.]
MPAITPQQVALAIGAGGAYVDVSQYVRGPEGVAYTYGRQDEFRDPNPGQFSFTLENQDGRFTPGNPNTPLVTPLTEGTGVCWNLGGRLVEGVVSAIGLASSEDQWGRVTITVGDSTYTAGRTGMLNLAAAIAIGAQPYFFWPFTDPAGSAQALETSGNNGPALSYLPDPMDGSMVLTFGAPATAPTGDNQLSVASTNLSQTIGYSLGSGRGPQVTYPASTLGAWGFWYTPGASSYLSLNVALSSAQFSVTLNKWSAQVVFQSTTGAAFTLPASTSAMYVSLVITYDSTNMFVALYVDGVLRQTTTSFYPSYNSPTVTVDSVLVYFTPNSGGLGTYQTSIAHLSHTKTLVHEEWAGLTSGANRWAALVSCVPSMKSGTVDANLAPVAHATQSTGGSNVLAAILDLVRTEQGHIYNTTTGTLTSPSTVTNFRARTRPTTVKASFDAQTELQGMPQFVHDVTNMVATVTATSPSKSATATDPTLAARVGTASASETVTLASATDVLMYAQDRLLRGKNVALRAVSITIDALLTPTDRSADLLGLVPGDRIRITNLPPTQLGFPTWDGWFLGASERHAPGASATESFTLYLAPVLPPPAIFDSDRFSAGTSLSLAGAVTASSSTLWVGSADGTLLSTSQTPYTLQVDSEQVTVTACTAVVPLNLLTNPSGRTSLTGYTGTNGTLVLQPGADTQLQVNASVAAGAAFITLESMTIGGGKLLPSTTYTFSATVVANPTSITVGVSGAGVTGGSAQSTIVPANTTTRISVTFTTTAAGAVAFLVSNGSAATSGNLIQFQDAQVELGSTMSGYATGNGQVATVTRAVNSTTAAAHNAAALVDVAPASIFAF